MDGAREVAMTGRSVGSILMIAGVVLVAVGFLVARGWLSWFGRLPGDIRIVSESTRVYIPITSMLLASVALTVVVNLIRKLW
jgi:membrane protein implicated in regulation of membrane protease activity